MKHRRLILAGAGHAHLAVLSRLNEYIDRDCEVTLISPNGFWYSGMAPGVLSETYRGEEHRLDTAKLVARKGGQFIPGAIARIDAREKMVTLDSGRTLAYDLLSLNVGSEVQASMIEGAESFGWMVKPVENLTRLRATILQHVSSGEILRFVIAGGGAAGCEVAINLWHLLERHDIPREISVISSGSALVEKEGRGASRRVAREFDRLGINLTLGRKVARATPDTVRLDDGSVLNCDFLVVATGVHPPPLFRHSGLPTAADGSLLVNPSLQCVTAPEIFGAGDCIGFSGGPPPRVGVYAVRQSKVLHHNLRASLENRTLKRFRPQKRYLLILNLGNGRGLFFWRSFAFRGRWAFLLKDFLDGRFLRKYRSGD